MKIKYSRKPLKRVTVGGVLLKDGINSLSDKDAEKLKKHPRYNEMIKTGILTLVDDSDKPVEAPEEPKPKPRRNRRKPKVEVEQPVIEITEDNG